MKIGIIGAMDVEVALLKEKMDITRTEEYARMTFCEGRIGSQAVVVVKSGIAKVNAAICVQILVDRFAVTHVINTGVAGSLDNEINIGDVVVSTEAQYHDVDATIFGYQMGEVPQLGVATFPADPKLRAMAVRAVKEAAPDINVFEGKVVSGDQFISTHDRKAELAKQFNGKCAEMEGTAIAQASWLNNIPYVIIRAISDKADESSSESYDVFEGKAARHCAAIVEYMIRNMGE